MESGAKALHLIKPGTIIEIPADIGMEISSKLINHLPERSPGIKYGGGGRHYREYESIGFKRERHLFSLKPNDELIAFFTIKISDVGLYMSDLINCMNVFVLDSEELTQDTLNLALPKLLIRFRQEDMPVLLFPISYLPIRRYPMRKPIPSG